MASPGEQASRVSSWQQHATFPVLLQHASINRNVKLVCLLLQVSKDIRSTLTAQCRGLLNVNRALQTKKQAESFFSWLAAHGMLLKKLEWSADTLLHVLLDHSAQVGAAFQTAVAIEASRLRVAPRQCRLLLQAYICSDSTAEGTAILQSLSPQHLQKLQLHLKLMSKNQKDCSSSTEALAQLTSLQDLTLHGQGALLAQHLSGLRQLTSLTRLLLGSLKHSKRLNCLPANLKELTIAQPENLVNQERTDPGGLSLGHLTALTKMILPRDWAIYGGDMLPGNLEVLEVGDSTCADPLLHLQRLKTLSLLQSTVDAWETNRLSAELCRLECVHLRYCAVSSEAAAAAAAAAWSSLPITGLKLMHQNLPRSIFGELAKLTGLTELHIMHQQPIIDLPLYLSFALTGLSRLAQLSLACVDPGNSHDGHILQFGTYHLCHSLCKLPQLSYLQLGGMPIMDFTATMISGATQLTDLQLKNCELSDYGVNSVVCGLSRLQSFCLSQKISPAVLPVIVAVLPRLTELQLLEPQCIIEDWAIEQLSKLSHLRELCIQGVSDAAIKKALRQDT